MTESKLWTQNKQMEIIPLLVFYMPSKSNSNGKVYLTAIKCVKHKSQDIGTFWCSELSEKQVHACKQL